MCFLSFLQFDMLLGRLEKDGSRKVRKFSFLFTVSTWLRHIRTQHVSAFVSCASIVSCCAGSTPLGVMFEALFVPLHLHQ